MVAAAATARARSRAARAARPEVERRLAGLDGADPGERRGRLGGAARVRRHADAQLVVLAGGRRERGRVLAERARDVGDAGRERQARRARRRGARRCAARGGARRSRGRRTGRSSRARPRPRARGPPPAAAAGAGSAARAAACPCARPSQDRQPRAGVAERAGHADEVARPRAVAPDERRRVVGPADDGHGERQRRAARDVAAGDRRRRSRAASACAAPNSSSTSSCPSPAGSTSARYASPGVGAHRGEVRQRAGERAVADVGERGDPSASAEVHALDHRVDATSPRTAAAAHDRGVVAEPAHDARASCTAAPLERLDQRELSSDARDAARQRWR